MAGRGCRNRNAAVVLLATLTVILSATKVRSDASDHRYRANDAVPLFANKVGPFHNPRVHENGNSASSKKVEKMKQKKLPLSICSIKDVESPADNNSKIKEKGSSENGENGAPVERTPAWKCQAFKAPSCVKQDKVMQS